MAGTRRTADTIALETATELAETVTEIEKLTVKRNRLIAKRKQQGAALRQIADEASMHHSGVAKVLAQ